MPTLGLKVQQDGYWRGWLGLFGGTSGFEVVDDSAGTSHDSAATYLTLRLLNLSQAKGRISFPVFLQAEGLVANSITINVAARRGGVSHPLLDIGLARSGLTFFHASQFDTTADWTVESRSFTEDPWSGLPWTPEHLVGLEACVSSDVDYFGPGFNEITLVSAGIDYVGLHSWTGREPQGAFTQ